MTINSSPTYLIICGTMHPITKSNSITWGGYILHCFPCPPPIDSLPGHVLHIHRIMILFAHCPGGECGRQKKRVLDLGYIPLIWFRCDMMNLMVAGSRMIRFCHSIARPLTLSLPGSNFSPSPSCVSRLLGYINQAHRILSPVTEYTMFDAWLGDTVSIYKKRTTWYWYYVSNLI